MGTRRYVVYHYMGHGSRTFFYRFQIHWRRAKTTPPNRFFAIQLINLLFDIESYLKKIFPSYDLNGIFFMFCKHNWNILNKSQVYSSPKMFFLSLATCVLVFRCFLARESVLPYVRMSVRPSPYQ